MSKLVLDVKVESELKDNYVIRYNKSKKYWEVVSYKLFNNDLYEERNKLQKQINDLKQELKEFKVGVNIKLKEYHDILQLLTKEN